MSNPKTIRGVDVSEYTTEIPFSWWEALSADHNVEAAVIQAWGGGYVPGRRNEHFGQHVEGALRSLLKISAYVWPPREFEPASRWIEQSGYKSELSFYAHDIEQGEGVAPGIVQAADQWLGRLSWMYGSPSSWAQIMGSTLQYADHPLWLGRYPLSPERPGGNALWWPESYVPFGPYRVGGWEEARGWQFQGTTTIDGESCDLNLFHADAFEVQAREEIDVWLDETIMGFDGQPLMFRVLQGDLTIKERALTNRQWAQLSQFKLIMEEQTGSGVPNHQHSGQITVQ